MKITNEILEGYLNCKTKGHLKLAGESGTKSDYEAMTDGGQPGVAGGGPRQTRRPLRRGRRLPRDRRHRRDAEAGGTAAGGRHRSRTTACRSASTP